MGVLVWIGYGLLALVGIVLTVLAPAIRRFLRVRSYAIRVPGVRASSIWGVIPGDKLHMMVADAHKQYGPVFTARMVHMWTYSFSSLNAHREVLKTKGEDVFDKDEFWLLYEDLLGKKNILTTNGETWEHSRKIINPAFSPAAMKEMQEHLLTSGKHMIERLGSSTKPFTVDMTQVLRDTSLEAIALCAFQQSFHDLAHVSAALDEYMHEKDQIVMHPKEVFHQIFPTKRNKKQASNLKILNEWADKCIEDHLATAQARQSGTEQSESKCLAQILATAHLAGDFPRDRVKNECLVFLLAGQETTSKAMGWAILALCRHPEIQESLYQELDTALAGGEPNINDLGALPLLNGIMKETLRLWPPAPLVSRMPRVDTEIDGTFIPAGALVVNAFRETQRDPELWEEPERFWPERWERDTEHGKERSYFANIPFSAGQRNCIGQRLAQNEFRTIIAMLVSRYKMRLSEEHPPPGEMFTLTHGPINLMVNLTPR